MPNNTPHPAPASAHGPAYDWKVGDGVTVCGYSDRRVYTIVDRPAKNRIVIQRDTVTIVADRRLWRVGGFAAHCPNPHDVDYSYKRDLTGETRVATLRKDGTWRIAGTKERVIAGRAEFDDVNF